ncbi:MAG: UDP-N-acetylglucosamine 2-epimerase (non-hydrolyzing) [Promethearchaeota archaeon Loki_b32]|nr:MAG: UDP-N-acetylglucosamine 2-epimerase (non-hydrolyzing) [Candidatus Lokiarchaeota archaeon Loki_b32]
MPKLIYLVVGARPNFMKIAPLIKEFKKEKIKFKLIHTGQHYDYNMSKVFFDDLGIPEPDIHLNIGSASHAVQTAKILIEFEKVLVREKVSLVVVVGDVNSTLACALVAKKLHIKVAHIEAGLRSFNMEMPEEINRLLTDQISDFLFTTEKSAVINLKREGISSDKIFFVGNIMIDVLIMNLEKAKELNLLDKYNLKKNDYALITLHRPSNVDTKENLEKMLNILNFLQEKIKVFFPIHPRTKKNLEKFDLEKNIKDLNIVLSHPIGYLEFLNLMTNSKLILTDSGGIQEEASYLKIPVLTARMGTERPVTVEEGTNTIIGRDIDKAKRHIEEIFTSKYKNGKNIEYWDGRASKRIVKVLKEKLNL